MDVLGGSSAHTCSQPGSSPAGIEEKEVLSTRIRIIPALLKADVPPGMALTCSSAEHLLLLQLLHLTLLLTAAPSVQEPPKNCFAS